MLHVYFLPQCLGAYWSKGDIHRNASLNPSGSCQWSPRLHRCDYGFDGRDRLLFVGSKSECLRINFDGICCEPSGTVNSNPTLFESREAAKPYSRGQWDSALKATPHFPKGDASYVRALEPTARSGAHGFRSRRPRSLLTVLNYCRVKFWVLYLAAAVTVFDAIGSSAADKIRVAPL
jgi:hypothetical protein